MAKAIKPVTEQTSIVDKKIVFSVQQFVTYSITFLTIGASIYTFFKALPKIDSLDSSLHDLREKSAELTRQVVDMEYLVKQIPEKHVPK